MSIETVRQVITRVVAEPGFMTQLRTAPGQVLAGLDLSEEETEALATMPSEALDQLAAALEPRLSHAVSPFPLTSPVQPSGF
jgi:hypothetical protein